MEFLYVATVFIIMLLGFTYFREKFDQKDKIPFDKHLELQ